MERDELPGDAESPVSLGPTPPPEAAPTDVLPAVVRSRADDSRRYICYSDSADAGEVAATRLSVDVDAVVSRELRR